MTVKLYKGGNCESVCALFVGIIIWKESFWRMRTAQSSPPSHYTLCKQYATLQFIGVEWIKGICRANGSQNVLLLLIPPPSPSVINTEFVTFSACWINYWNIRSAIMPITGKGIYSSYQWRRWQWIGMIEMHFIAFLALPPTHSQLYSSCAVCFLSKILYHWYSEMYEICLQSDMDGVYLWKSLNHVTVPSRWPFIISIQHAVQTLTMESTYLLADRINYKHTRVSCLDDMSQQQQQQSQNQKPEHTSDMNLHILWQWLADSIINNMWATTVTIHCSTAATERPIAAARIAMTLRIIIMEYYCEWFRIKFRRI